MSESTINVLVSGLMGIFGGMITISINGLISGFFKHEELLYQHQLDIIKMKKEKTLQHQMDIELQKISASNEELAKLKGEMAQLRAAVARLAGMAQR
jgi:hypothetical protein